MPRRSTAEIARVRAATAMFLRPMPVPANAAACQEQQQKRVAVFYFKQARPLIIK